MQVSGIYHCLAVSISVRLSVSITYPVDNETLNRQQHAVRWSPLTLHAIGYGHDKKDTWSVTPRVVIAIEFHADLLCQMCTCCKTSDEQWMGLPSNMHASSGHYNVAC